MRISSFVAAATLSAIHVCAAHADGVPHKYSQCVTDNVVRYSVATCEDIKIIVEASRAACEEEIGDFVKLFSDAKSEYDNKAREFAKKADEEHSGYYYKSALDARIENKIDCRR